MWISGWSKQNGTLGGDNLKAAIFNAGFREGCLLLPQLGARAEVAFGPAGLGDLYVTATSPHGRNRRMGEKLGSGLTLEQALEENRKRSAVDAERFMELYQLLPEQREPYTSLLDATNLGSEEVLAATLSILEDLQ